MFRFIRINFYFAIFASVAVAIILLASSNSYSGPFLLRVALGLSAYVVFQVVMWFFEYRHDGGEGAAFIIGILSLINIVPILLGPQVTDRPLNTVGVYIFLYFGLSNLAYAIAIYRMSKQSWWLDR
jgi:uncharacterized membrane protein HdeD (DUF308 family)